MHYRKLLLHFVMTFLACYVRTWVDFSGTSFQDFKLDTNQYITFLFQLPSHLQKSGNSTFPELKKNTRILNFSNHITSNSFYHRHVKTIFFKKCISVSSILWSASATSDKFLSKNEADKSSNQVSFFYLNTAFEITNK